MRHLGIGLIIGWVALPTGLAAWHAWPAADPVAIVSFLARITGIAGLACILGAALLSVRVPGWDRPFGGLTRLWRFHHYVGLAAFILVLLHPVLLALAATLEAPGSVATALFPPFDEASTRAISIWTGWFAFAALLIFLAPSFQFFGRPDYQRWKALHFLSGAAVVGALAHGLMIDRALPAPAGTLIWGMAGGLAVAVVCWRTFLARRVVRTRYRIEAVDQPADRVVEIRLAPARGRPPNHAPGQFVYFTPLDDALAAGRGEEHPYTISSPPGSQTLAITVKSLGDASQALQTLAPGTPALVEGPYGDFFPEPLRRRPQLWIGGGIGITPFLSAARAGVWQAGWGDTVLVNCTNDPSRAYYLEELKRIAGEHAGLIVHGHFFQTAGALSADFLQSVCPDAGEREWFVCGPPILTDIAAEIARRTGVPRHRFHSEKFDFL